MTSTFDLQSKYELSLYPMRSIALARGAGSKVWDEDGREYIDCVSGNGVANVGHCNKEVVDAATEQLKTLITCSGGFYHRKRAELFEKLVQISPASLTRAFLCNSGAETSEAALKFARYHTKRKKFVCAMRGFHGRTMGALTATYNPAYKEEFEPLLSGFTHVPFNNIDKMAAAVDDDTAGVMLEVIQGEGGVNVGQGDYLRAVQKLCRDRGALFIVDEVQTGFCRTGKMFASEHHSLEPDIMTLAKALAGGIPIGAVLVNEEIKIDQGKHGTTFGGNPVACAAALAAINFMQREKLADAAAEKGSYIFARLRENKESLTKMRDVRGMGLMIGIELKDKSKPLIEELMNRGILTLPAGPTVLRLLPPLVITQKELDTVCDELIRVLS